MKSPTTPAADHLNLDVTRVGLSQDLRVFDRFRLRRVLGKGGMGVVWLAWDEKANREVALKFMPDIVAGNAAALQDMRRETRNGIKLSHQHVVTMYDLVEENESAAIIMEYVKGTNLDIMRRSQPNQVFEAATLEPYVHQLLDALEYAHNVAKMAHCDLKPANLMVDEHDVLKVADFGIARNLSDTVSRISAKFNGSGSLAYMSPQQMMGENPTAADDIYALGSTLYELLTGKPPFHTGSLATQIETSVPPPMSERRTQNNVRGVAPIPPAWENVVAACLEKRPEERPASIEAIRQGLHGQKFLRASGQTATMRRPAVRPKKQSAPAAGGLTLTQLAIAAAVVVGVGGFFFGGREKKTIKPLVETRAPASVEDENLKTASENVAAFQKLSASDFASAWEYRMTCSEVRKKVEGMAPPGDAAWSSLLDEVKRIEKRAEAEEAREKNAYQANLKNLQERHQSAVTEAAREDLNAAAKMKIWQDFLAALEDQEFNEDYGHSHENLLAQATVEYNRMQILASTSAPISLASGPEVVTSEVMKSWSQSEKEVVVRRVQEALQSSGYYAGSVDGKHGLKLHQALLAYQEKEQMPTSARIDDHILTRLKVDTSRPPQQVVVSRPSGGGGSSSSRPAASSQPMGVPEQIMRWSGAVGSIGNARAAWGR